MDPATAQNSRSIGCACTREPTSRLMTPHRPPPRVPGRNLFKNANFESGLTSWYFNHGPEQFNLRRTFGRASFAVSRLLGNFGVSGSTPLLERFGDPVGASQGPSVLRNGDFSAAASRQRRASGPSLADIGSSTRFPKAPPAPASRCPARRAASATHYRAARRRRGQAAGNHDRPARNAHPGRPMVSAVVEEPAPRACQARRLIGPCRIPPTGKRFSTTRPSGPRPNGRPTRSSSKAKDTASQRDQVPNLVHGTGKLWLADVRLEPIQDPTAGRWLDGLYLTRPTEWDDPYRFFGW